MTSSNRHRNIAPKKRIRIEPDLGPLENEYRLHFLDTDIDQATLGLVAGFVSVTLLSYIDFLFYGISPIFYELALIRFIFLVLSLTTLHILRKTKRVAVYDYCVFLWWMSLTAVILVVDYYRPANYVQNQMIHVLAAFCCYTVIPFPLHLRFIPAILITTWDIVELFFFKTAVPKPVLNVTLATFVIMQCMGVIVSARMYSYRRKQYLAQLQEQKLNKDLEVMATTDSLTSLLNRRYFFELAEKEFASFKRYGNRFTMMMADMDHFKKINDGFGHPVGDEVLRRFGGIILENKRRIDFAGRLGGEEFGALLTGTNLEGAMVFAERIRQNCAGICVQTDKGCAGITVSIGVTEVCAEDQSLDDVLKRMDKALYAAKNLGRNRCEVI